MAEFKFIGDPRANGHGPATFQVPGYVFGRDAWTLVDDAEAVERFRRHSHLVEKQFVTISVNDIPRMDHALVPKRRGRPRKV